ncbi:MAG: right-handed parallel beta-helix repeat-containing protein [Nitrososphaerota archaeon]|nr:right-handed parallel beta-helix repeat-containing protein [Nitrososphaerota archaeon]
MKMLLVVFLIISVVLSGLANVSAQASTSVSGIIVKDITWTKATSPYVLTGALGILGGVTLTIEPGVIVDFAGNYMQVNGTLNARGTNTEPIQLTNHGGVAVIFNGDTASNSVIENANLNLADITIEGASPKFINSVLNCRISISEGAPQIINNKFITGDGLVLYDSNATIAGNVFSRTSQAIYVGSSQFYSSPLIAGNLIVDNTYGILMPCSATFNPIIQNNTIANNTEGIGIWRGYGSGVPLPTISYNNIYGNRDYNFRLTNIGVNVDATYNWWGTSDEGTITASIFDFKKDFSLGNVTFKPFLTEPNPQAIPDTVLLSDFTDKPQIAPNPTAEPSPTPTPDYSNNFNIESNSTVTAFAFNSSIPEITFTVSGITGTAGYVKATISKNFMSNADNIRVYLDGIQTDCTIKSNDNSWVVLFTYHHSNHHITISAADSIGAWGFPSWVGQITATILAAVFIIATILVVWLRRKTRQ